MSFSSHLFPVAGPTVVVEISMFTLERLTVQVFVLIGTAELQSCFNSSDFPFVATCATEKLKQSGHT